MAIYGFITHIPHLAFRRQGGHLDDHLLIRKLRSAKWNDFLEVMGSSKAKYKNKQLTFDYQCISNIQLLTR